MRPTHSVGENILQKEAPVILLSPAVMAPQGIQMAVRGWRLFQSFAQLDTPDKAHVNQHNQGSCSAAENAFGLFK